MAGEPECGWWCSQEKDAEKADDAGAEEAWGAVIAAAGRLLEQIDGEKLQASLAKRMPADADDAAKKAREEEEKQKKALLSALCATAKAQAALAQREGAEPAALEAMDETLVSRHHDTCTLWHLGCIPPRRRQCRCGQAALALWVSPLEHSPRLMVAVERAHGRLACALEALEAFIVRPAQPVGTNA